MNAEIVETGRNNESESENDLFENDESNGQVSQINTATSETNLKSDGDGDESDDEELEKNVEEMQYLSKKNIFPKKVFKFGDIN